MRLFALLAPGSACTEDVAKMTGPEVQVALTGSSLAYDNGAPQDFCESGRILYTSGRESRAHRVVREGQYCSPWPPSDLWTCHDRARNGDAIRFSGEAGDTTDRTYSD